MMLSSENKSKVKSKKSKRPRTFWPGVRSLRAGALLFCLFTLTFLFSACRRDMQDQPKAITYRENTFFRDGLSSRNLVPGTVPRGYLRADREFYLGKKANPGNTAANQAT